MMEDKLKNVPELKFYDSRDSIRERFLKYVAKYEPEAYALTLDKEGCRVDDTPYNYAITVGKLLASVVSKRKKRILRYRSIKCVKVLNREKKVEASEQLLHDVITSNHKRRN